MRFFTAIVFFLSMIAGVNAQSSNLIFFTEDGEKFTLFVNGEQKNRVPLSNVRAEGLNVERADVRIVFATSGLPELKQGMMVEPGMEFTAIIKKNNKGNYVMRPSGSVPVSQSTPATETVYVNQPANTVGTQGTSTTVTTTSTTVVPVDNNNGTIGVTVSDGQNSMNINMNVAGVNAQPVTGTTVTTTSVTTSNSNSVTSNTNSYSGVDGGSQTNQVYSVGGGCAEPMYSDDFERAKRSIANKSFSDDKMTILKQILKANCVSCRQVIGFMGLFSFEADKLAVAKTAYASTVDKENYYKINDAFTFSGSVDELNKFLQDK